MITCNTPHSVLYMRSVLQHVLHHDRRRGSRRRTGHVSSGETSQRGLEQTTCEFPEGRDDESARD